MEQMTMSSKGQVVIPKEIRDRMGAKRGQKFVIEEVDGSYILIPVPKNPIKALRGLAKGTFRKSATQLVREEREAWD